MLDIEDFMQQYKRKIPNILLLWYVVIIFIIIILLTTNNTLKYHKYYQTEGVIVDGYLKLYVPLDKLNIIDMANGAYINKEWNGYEIVSIGQDNFELVGKIYKEVFLNIQSDKKYIENNIFKVKFLVEKKTIFEYMIDLFKGE